MLSAFGKNSNVHNNPANLLITNSVVSVAVAAIASQRVATSLSFAFSKTTFTSQTVLDVTPYNVIVIMCNVTQPIVVNISKRILWEQVSPSGLTLALRHDGTITNITNIGVDRSTSSSVLTLLASSAGRWIYRCNSSIEIPGDPIIAYSQVAEVVEKGIVFLLTPNSCEEYFIFRCFSSK